MEDVAAKTLDQVRLLRALVNFSTDDLVRRDSAELENQREQISRCVHQLEEHLDQLIKRRPYLNGQAGESLTSPVPPGDDVITQFMRTALPAESQRIWKPNHFTGSLLVFFVDGKIDSGSLIEKKMEPLDTDMFGEDDGNEPTLGGNGVEFHVEPVESFSILKTRHKRRVNIRFALPEASNVTIQIYDSRDRLIRSFQRRFDSAGDYTQEWDGRDESGNTVPDAQYYCQLQIGDSVTGLQTILL
jgi:hypothetical protein